MSMSRAGGAIAYPVRTTEHENMVAHFIAGRNQLDSSADSADGADQAVVEAVGVNA